MRCLRHLSHFVLGQPATAQSRPAGAPPPGPACAPPLLDPVRPLRQDPACLSGDDLRAAAGRMVPRGLCWRLMRAFAVTTSALAARNLAKMHRATHSSRIPSASRNTVHSQARSHTTRPSSRYARPRAGKPTLIYPRHAPRNQFMCAGKTPTPTSEDNIPSGSHSLHAHRYQAQRPCTARSTYALSPSAALAAYLYAAL